MIFNFFRKKSRVLLALDIGDTSVKAMFFEKKGGKVNIISASVKKIEQYGANNNHNFERSAFKGGVLGAIEMAERNAFLSDIESDLKKKISKGYKKVILTFSPKFLKTDIFKKAITRRDGGKIISVKEERKLTEQVLTEAKEKISSDFIKNCGIFPENIIWVSSEIISRRIDSYSFSFLAKKTGNIVEFEVFTSFIQESYLNEVKGILNKEGKYHISKISHLADSIDFLPQESRKNSVYLDIGGDLTQVFVLKHNKLKTVFNFEGGSYFTNAVSSDLKTDEILAEKIMHRYSGFGLDKNLAEKVKKIISQRSLLFLNNLSLNIKEKTGQDFFSSDVYIFGGGANLTDIKNTMENEVVHFSGNVKIMYSEDIKNLKNIGRAENPQFVPAALICFS